VIFCARTCPYRWPVLMGCMYGSCRQSTRTHPYLRPIFTGCTEKSFVVRCFFCTARKYGSCGQSTHTYGPYSLHL